MTSMTNMANYKEKKQVFIGVKFLKIGEIDTAKEYFSAEAIIEAKWREPHLDDQSTSTIQFEEFWNPKIVIANLFECKNENISKKFVVENGKAFIYETRRIKGTFTEQLELRDFPFDSQQLCLTLISDSGLSLEELEFLRSSSTIKAHEFIDEQEWRLFHYVASTCQPYYQAQNQPSISFSCQAARRSGFYFWNIFFVLIFICTMTFTTFAVIYQKTENRLQLTFILLLATVAFRTNVNTSVPKIPYLTKLDLYVIGSMVIQCVVCIWHAIVGGVLLDEPLPKDTALWADKWVLISLGSLYIISNIVFFAFLFIKVYLRDKRYSQLENNPAMSATTATEYALQNNGYQN